MPKVMQIPDALRNDNNRVVLKFLEGTESHSDISSAMFQAAEPLGGVHYYSSEPNGRGYDVLATQDTVFAFAYGMSSVGFLLDEGFRKRALETGGKRARGAGINWVTFELFRSNYPAFDLEFWARKSYLVARGSDPW